MKEIRFKQECKNYLKKQSLVDLRSYGRYLNLVAPTTLRKEALILEILGVLSGESYPQRSKRGAPVKNSRVSAEIVEKINEIKDAFYHTQPVGEGGNNEGKKVVEHDCVDLSYLIEKLTARQKELLKEFLYSLLK